jgi:hypothetical protein
MLKKGMAIRAKQYGSKPVSEFPKPVSEFPKPASEFPKPASEFPKPVNWMQWNVHESDLLQREMM